jgi:hypothetical protein
MKLKVGKTEKTYNCDGEVKCGINLRVLWNEVMA